MSTADTTQMSPEELEFWTDPDGASCEHCGAPCSQRAQHANETCRVCGHRLMSGEPNEDFLHHAQACAEMWPHEEEP